jgi:hypothetical protein
MACKSRRSDPAADLMYGNGANSPAAATALVTSIRLANQSEREPIEILESCLPRERNMCGIGLRC